MATLHETAYPRLKPDPTAKELAEIYTPTETEMAFVRGITKQPTTQLAVIIHLKLFQRLAYFTLLADGWGSGWATNNVLRFNTIGPNAPIWIARTVLPGANAQDDDFFAVQMRGDSD